MTLVDLAVGMIIGFIAGMGLTSIFWIRDKRKTTKRLTELEQRVRDIKLQLWLAWKHYSEFEDVSDGTK